MQPEAAEPAARIPALTVPQGAITAYPVMYGPPAIRIAPVNRSWMDGTAHKFAYRCLPMTMANQLGWDIINPLRFTAIWNGGPTIQDIHIDWPTEETSSIVLSHFGYGILTFSIGYLFRTPPGVNMLAMGPTNYPKHGIHALTGLIETDWLAATFTMNWLFTRPGVPVTFEAGESVCRVIPFPRYMTEVLNPEIRNLSENPALYAEHEAWKESRGAFNNGLKIPGSPEAKQGWQKDYSKGGGALWDKFQDHQTRLQQEEFQRVAPKAV
jgi:hypothetical protein